jgi:hypothetical protein
MKDKIIKWKENWRSNGKEIKEKKGRKKIQLIVKLAGESNNYHNKIQKAEKIQPKTMTIKK